MERYTSAHWGSYRITPSGLTPVQGDPEPAQAGKDWLSSAENPATRIARPAFRKDWLSSRDKSRSGDASFVELPWDEALDIIAEELSRTIKTHGNQAIYAGTYGWASAGRFHHAQSQLKRFLNCIGGYSTSRDTYSHAGAEVLWPHVVGLLNDQLVEAMTTWDQIADHCKLLVAFGGISPRTGQISSGGTSSHGVGAWLDRMRGGSCRLVNISPIASDLQGAEWMSIRPGADRALILALSHVILSRGLEDRGFLERCTDGFDRYRASVMGELDGVPKSPEWAEAICGVPADAIERLAIDMAGTPTMISMAWSLQRQDRGEETIWAGFNLACLLGQIGKPGCGYGFGYGSLNTVGRPTKIRRWPALPQGRNPVSSFIPVARIAEMLENPGGAFRYDGETHTYPDARIVWWSGGNPFHHHQDLNRLSKAWQNPDLVIVNDHSWTATARRADIVLPCTSPLEREDIMMMRYDPAVVYMSAAREPFGEARDDYDIFCDLADRMGVADAFSEGRTSQDWLRELWLQARERCLGEGVNLPAFDDFRHKGWIDLPNSDQSRTLFADFVNDPETHPVGTESGKLQMASSVIGAMGGDTVETPGWSEPVEWLGSASAGELHLISAQPANRLHSQNDSGDLTKAGKRHGRETCWLHPATASRYALAAGDVAELNNTRGACLATVELSDTMREDCILLPTGAWLDIADIDGRPVDVHGNPNVLTIDKGSSELSQGNSAHTTLVQVRKWRGNLPPVQVFDGPRIVSRN